MKTISVINMKGGVAKTTLAINLADCLVRRHSSKVLIVDVDPQFNATQCLMKPEVYVDHLKSGGDTIVSVFDRNKRAVSSTVNAATTKSAKKAEEITVVSVKPKLDLLPGNLELYRLEMAPGEGRENRLNTYLSKLSKENTYDFVIIDTPPTPSVWMTSALIASDYYLIPVKADPLSLTGIDLLRSIIEEKIENFNLNIKCAGLVLTITESSTNVYNEAKGTLTRDIHWKKFLYKATLPKRTRIASRQIKQMHILDGDCIDSKTAIANITTEFFNCVAEHE
ncbi:MULTISPECIES: ParA family protein [unclassified Janthinobacterium]|uniref:ParA family protein n=1 Tax=unclassified Janthinobacterium TaxID=2610881 RepID=UPI00160F13CB|nr:MULTISPECIES: AAA family ATPase [unclassified Janthinobacterium]MBB5369870.1 chromosome partitioning protein [Janthinobacterium sp. K2C7]MBB5382676.1 chromosome partitioning protein [Janthinobacterium sp. K2Li3]MBB5384661.1 chromosome partitioning protein [Janthinobacterium sp. K2E3]